MYESIFIKDLSLEAQSLVTLEAFAIKSLLIRQNFVLLTRKKNEEAKKIISFKYTKEMFITKQLRLSNQGLSRLYRIKLSYNSCENLIQPWLNSFSTSSSNNGDSGNPPKEGWAWIPPRAMEHLDSDSVKKRFKLPINVGTLIPPGELKTFLEENGGENVVVLNLNRPLVDISTFVISSFSSTRLIRKAAEAIKENLKDRELYHVLGSKEIEGGKDEEWQAVDCQNTLVHLMLPETRRHIDLEGHWSAKDKPVVNLSSSDDEFDRKMEELLDKYPVPEDYLKEEETKSAKFQGFDQEVKSL